MSKLAVGREAVVARREAPPYGASSSWRSIPPEPDELWDALTTFDTVVALNTAIAAASGARLTGLVAEQLRQKERLNEMLERISITDKTLEALSQDTAPAVTAVNLAPIGEDETSEARLFSNPDFLVVTLKARGFGHEESRSLRIEYVNTAGAQRSIPMEETRHTVDMALVEWTAPGPLSSFQAGVGSQVSIVLDVVLRSGRNVSRCVERFVLG